MFDKLIVSNPQKGAKGTVVSSTVPSMSLHGLRVWAAVVATISTAEVVSELAEDTTMVFLQEEEEPVAEDAPPE